MKQDSYYVESCEIVDIQLFDPEKYEFSLYTYDELKHRQEN